MAQINTSSALDVYRQDGPDEGAVPVQSLAFGYATSYVFGGLAKAAANRAQTALDWPEWIHVTGYWFLDTSDDSKDKKWQPPSGLLDFMEKAKKAKKKIIYIGFGSIVVQDPEELTRTISQAVERAGVAAIVSKGWSARLASSLETDKEKKEFDEQQRKEKEMMPDSIFTVDVSQPLSLCGLADNCAVHTARLALQSHRCSVPSRRCWYDRCKSAR